MMKIVLAGMLGLAALAAVPASSQAADGCGRGWYSNGYRCVPMQGPRHAGPRYGYYDDGPRVYYRERPRPRYADPSHPYGYNFDYGDPRCGRPNYTIQDGVCKPYRGH